MSTLAAQKVRFETLKSLAAASVVAGYTIVGSTFAHPVRILKVVNDTDGDVTISYDGVNDQDFIPANGAFIYDYGSDKSGQAQNLEQPVGFGVYVKRNGAAPTVKSVYVVVIYADNS